MSNITTALFSLWQQSIDRGFAGRLEDFDIKLCEDDRTISIWAFYQLDEPLMASIELPEAVDPASFDLSLLQRSGEVCSGWPFTSLSRRQREHRHSQIGIN